MRTIITNHIDLCCLALLSLISCGRYVELPVADLVVRTPIGYSGTEKESSDLYDTSRPPLVVNEGDTLRFLLPRCRQPHALFTWKGDTPGTELEILIADESPLRLDTGGGDLRVELGPNREEAWELGLRAVGGNALIREARVFERVPEDIASSYRNGSAQPNILLLIIDTLRADHLGCYGDGRSLTPELDSLAAHGVVFENAMSPANGTLPSISSLLSGVYPHRHGVYDNVTSLESKWTTLPELLKSHGYSTAAVVGAHHLNPNGSGFGEGFDHFGKCTQAQRTADDVVNDALLWLNEHKDDRFFLLVHLFDPHTPYAPPKQIERLFYSGDPKNSENTSMNEVWFPPGQRAYMRRWLGGITDIDWPLSMYAGEVHFASKEAGRLFSVLEAQNLSQRTLVIVTADHGESLTEHGIFFGHGGMYQEVLDIPLIIKLPGVIPEEERIAFPVENVGVYPTIAELVRIPLPAHVQSRPLPLSRISLKPHTLLSEAGFHASIVARKGNWKLIHNLRRQYFSKSETELYDLNSDPNETNNLAAVTTASLDSLVLRIQGVVAEKQRYERTTPTRISAEQKRKLEALGYIQ